jgi:hypothetical protein
MLHAEGRMKKENETIHYALSQEFYTTSNQHGWSHRISCSKPPPLSENPVALHLIDRLGELEKQTHPGGGTPTSKGKDMAAFVALDLCGKLIDFVAGWAIDHQVGLAIERLQFVPFQPSQTKSHPHYLQQKAMVDDHRHENIGALARGSSDPQFLRACLINLLRCNSGGWPNWLCRTVIDALEALEFGEVHPIFKRARGGNKRDLTERRLMLRAVAMVHFRRFAYSMTKQDARKEVAEAMGVSHQTVKSWEGRLKGEIPLQVARTLASAENHATWVADSFKRSRRGELVDLKLREYHEGPYNRQALELLAREYRAALSRS